MTVGERKPKGYQAGLVVCVVIIVVLGVGFVSTYQNLLSQINSLNADKINLQSQVNSLTSDKTNLKNQVNSLQSQINSLNSQIATLQAQINALNQSYTELLRKYEDLLFHFNLLNKPASNFTTIKDLNITLALHRSTYYYQDPVSGNVTITYLNGTAFRGEFILYIQHLTKETTSTTSQITIHGFTEFYLSPPVFRFGPGNYSIGISSLSTADGYIIESRWIMFPSVKVEAK